MKFKVYHAKQPKFGLSGGDPEFNDQNYEEVATVECKDLEHVYQVTNHIDHDWTTNKEVLSCNASVRSTSCGDVVVDADGQAWRVLFAGFGKI